MTPDEVKDIQRWLDASKGLADGRPFLGDVRLDALIDVLLEISAQLWVLKRRNGLLEAALADAGVLPPGAVEDYRPDADLKAALQEQRAAFVAAIFRSFTEVSTEPDNPGTNKEDA